LPGFKTLAVWLRGMNVIWRRKRRVFMMITLRNDNCADSKRHSQHLWILDLNPGNEIDSLSYSIQPNLCPETVFQACLPSFNLRNVVSYFHQVHISEKAMDRCIYPTGNIALIFRCDPLNPNVYLVGTPTFPRMPEYIDIGLDYFIVFFCIGEGSDLCPIPASDFVDTYIPMDMLCFDEVEKIAQQIACSGTFTERVRCFERFIMRQNLSFNKPPNHLKAVIETICNGIIFDNRRQPAYLSDRQIRRLFKKYLGISPTFFKRMIRHQKSLKALNCDPYQDLAILSSKLGYCDQSHFIHEFKRFHGIPPVRFVKKYLRAE
jgi:AraC-like DNA-binding protein